MKKCLEEKFLELRPFGDDTEICVIDDIGNIVYYENRKTKIKMDAIEWEGSYIPDGIDMNDPDIKKQTFCTSIDGVPIGKIHEIYGPGKIYCIESNEHGIRDYRFNVSSENTFSIYLHANEAGYIYHSENPKYKIDSIYEELSRTENFECSEEDDTVVVVYKDKLCIKCFTKDGYFCRELSYEGKLNKTEKYINPNTNETLYNILDSEGNILIKEHGCIDSDGLDIRSAKYGDGSDFYNISLVQTEFGFVPNKFEDYNNLYLKRGEGFIHNYKNNPLDGDFIMIGRADFGIPLFCNKITNI